MKHKKYVNDNILKKQTIQVQTVHVGRVNTKLFHLERSMN